MRIGLREMRMISKLLFSSVKDSTFFESCGVADLITTCCKDKFFILLCFFLYFLSLSQSNQFIFGSGRKKQEGSSSFCKAWREEVHIATLKHGFFIWMLRNIVAVYDFTFSHVGLLMNLRQRCCRAKNCRFLFPNDMINS